MSVIVAPWLRQADVLGAASSGASLGLQRRAADQRDAEMAQRAWLAEQENARQAQNAELRLRQDYDALAQARELALLDDEYRKSHDERLMEQNALKLLQDKAEADALAQYRAQSLKARETAGSKPKGPTFHKSGEDIYYGSNPEDFQLVVKKEQVPMVDMLIDPKKPDGSKMRLRLDDPLLNQRPGALPPDLAAIAGTNFQSRLKAPVAQAPKSTAPSIAPPPAPAPASQPAAPAAKKRSAKEKADLANAIANANPNLTREEILIIVGD